MRLTLDEVGAALGGGAAQLEGVVHRSLTVTARLQASAVGVEPALTGYSVDTRTLLPGDLFFALRGPAHDGNDYIEEAFRKGAAAVIADVPDSLGALQKLAAWARGRWKCDVVGITGSAGKTSTKEVVAALLETELRVGKNCGNLNNHVGLPLSILRMQDDIEIAVLELGMNHAGEIRELAKIARPRVGVVTNVGYAHIEFFESIEGIAAAKRELVEALPEDGIAVLNVDDERVLAMRPPDKRSVTFGLGASADVHAEDVKYLSDRTLFRACGVDFETRLIGRHGVRNILAGIAVAGVCGIAPARLRKRVNELRPPKMRGERGASNGVAIIDDSYNSNPDAAKAMLETLHDSPARRRIAVLGEMLELGRWSPELHREVGRAAAANGIDVLIAVHGDARYMAEGATEAGMPTSAVHFTEDPAPAGRLAREIAQVGDLVLFKGSRGTRVELALASFGEPS